MGKWFFMAPSIKFDNYTLDTDPDALMKMLDDLIAKRTSRIPADKELGQILSSRRVSDLEAKLSFDDKTMDTLSRSFYMASAQQPSASGYFAANGPAHSVWSNQTVYMGGLVSPAMASPNAVASTESAVKRYTVSEENAIIGYHFLPYSRRLANDDNRLAYGGVTFHAPKVYLCGAGFHSSRRIVDALTFAQSPILRRVKSWGIIEESSNKLAAEYQYTEWIADVDLVLHKLALDAAVQRIAGVSRVSGYIPGAVALKQRHIRAMESYENLPEIEDEVKEFERIVHQKYSADWEGIGFHFGYILDLCGYLAAKVPLVAISDERVTKPDLEYAEKRVKELIKEEDLVYGDI